MNKPIDKWTFQDLEYFISENDLSIKEVVALLGSGMTEMAYQAHLKHNSAMEFKYREILTVIMPIIISDLAAKFPL